MNEPIHYRLIEHLARASVRKDGRMQSALRRGWAQPLALYPIVAPFLPTPRSRVAEDVSILIALLFGEHSGVGAVPFAAALRRADGDRGETRFVAILTATRAELPRHLRRAMGAVKTTGAGLDWDALFRDLLRWDEPAKPAQRAWARLYWAGVDAAVDLAEDAPPTTETNDEPAEETP